MGCVVLVLWGVFVKTTRRRRGDKVYEYLSLVESVRKGSKTSHRTLLRLGEVTALRQSGQLGRIVAALERHLHNERVDIDGIAAREAPAVGAVAATAAVWERLGLGGFFAQVGARRGAEALEHAVFAMVANRLVAPCFQASDLGGRNQHGRLVTWSPAPGGQRSLQSGEPSL